MDVCHANNWQICAQYSSSHSVDSWYEEHILCTLLNDSCLLFLSLFGFSGSCSSFGARDFCLNLPSARFNVIPIYVLSKYFESMEIIKSPNIFIVLCFPLAVRQLRSIETDAEISFTPLWFASGHLVRLHVKYMTEISTEHGVKSLSTPLHGSRRLFTRCNSYHWFLPFNWLVGMFCPNISGWFRSDYIKWIIHGNFSGTLHIVAISNRMKY